MPSTQIFVHIFSMYLQCTCSKVMKLSEASDANLFSKKSPFQSITEFFFWVHMLFLNQPINKFQHPDIHFFLTWFHDHCFWWLTNPGGWVGVGYENHDFSWFAGSASPCACLSQWQINAKFSRSSNNGRQFQWYFSLDINFGLLFLRHFRLFNFYRQISRMGIL